MTAQTLTRLTATAAGLVAPLPDADPAVDPPDVTTAPPPDDHHGIAAGQLHHHGDGVLHAHDD